MEKKFIISIYFNKSSSSGHHKNKDIDSDSSYILKSYFSNCLLAYKLNRMIFTMTWNGCGALYKLEFCANPL